MIPRRDLITLLCSAAAWPLAARAQKSAIPVIGYLNFGSPESDAPRLTGIRRGLNFAYPVGCQSDASVIMEGDGPPRLSDDSSRVSAGFPG